ncbi:MAG: hypothetical protein KU38_10940 [Sulfurovum sp. FS08-3]|nr:MAG: hypothetical protein KU38_10940 [Sulfurovum sp. FS08-3]
MQTIELNVDDRFYNDIVKSGIDLQHELKKMLKRAIYKKEHTIADEIKQGLSQIEHFKQGKIELQDANNFLGELKSAH